MSAVPPVNTGTQQDLGPPRTSTGWPTFKSKKTKTELDLKKDGASEDPSTDLVPVLSQVSAGRKKKSRGSARSPSSFTNNRPPLPSIAHIVAQPPPHILPIQPQPSYFLGQNFGGLPREVFESASAAAAVAAANAAAAVAAEYFRNQERANLLPSRPVSASSMISFASSTHTFDSAQTTTGLKHRPLNSVSTVDTTSTVQGSTVTDDFIQDYLQMELSDQDASQSSPSFMKSRLTEALLEHHHHKQHDHHKRGPDHPTPVHRDKDTRSECLVPSESGILHREQRFCNNYASSSDPIAYPAAISHLEPPNHAENTENTENTENEKIIKNKKNYKTSKLLLNQSPSSTTSIPICVPGATQASSFSTPSSSSSSSSLSSSPSTSALFNPHKYAAPVTPTSYGTPNTCTSTAARDHIPPISPRHSFRPLSRSSSSSSSSTFSFAAACPTPSISPRSSSNYSADQQQQQQSQQQHLKFSPSSTPRIPPSTKVASSNSFPASASGPDDPPPPPSSRQEPQKSDLWTFFYNFTSNTRHSDSLVYALARKEAYMQNMRLAATAQNSSEIIDLWIMMALRYVMKGQLLFSPPAQHIHDSATMNNSIVLDIQGVFRDQWSWQMALDFPKVMVYSFKFASNPSAPLAMLQARGQRTTEQQGPEIEPSKLRKNSVASTASSIASAPSKYDIDAKGICPQTVRNVRPGPLNHVSCLGHSLKKLPFDDNTFDVLSAKSLWYFVKKDEWLDVLQEFRRVLKPGGYLEIVISDYGLLNSNESDEYWWKRLRAGVRRHNMEPFPSIKVPDHLYNAGFKDVHSALLKLPRGGWSGQVGHVTDLLSMYYSESMFRAFGDFSAEELDAFKASSTASIASDYRPANGLNLIYARKN